MGKGFQFQPLEIPGLTLVGMPSFEDDRGWFREVFKSSEFARHGIPAHFPQDNHVRSAKGVLRGLHYQIPPAAQGKLVRCIRGEVFDATVDMRRGSPTYGQWVGVTLRGEHPQLLWVPVGLAHGVCSLTEGAEVLYKVTAEYSPAHDRSIRWNDPAVGVRWPAEKPSLSPKDAAAPLLAEAENPFRWVP